MIPPGLRFTLVMLRRESRASAKRLLLYVLCIAAGVGGLVAVKSFGAAVERAVQGEARSLLAADLALRGNRPFTPQEEAALASLERSGARVTRSTQFLSMARSPGGRVLLVDVRAVGGGYPFYGEVRLAGGAPLRSVLTDDTAVVHPALLLNMGLKVGDALTLGRKTFRIAGELVKEPDGPVQLMSIGPRVLLTEGGGEATGLIAPTSHIRYGALIKLPEGRDPALSDPHVVAKALRERLKDGFASVSTYDQAQPQVTRFLEQLGDYLGLTGLVALLLGGIGVAGAIRVFMAQKLDTLAVLKCLGATGNRLLGVYLLQALVLGILGSLLGVALGLATQWVLAGLLADLLPVTVGWTVSWRALGEGLLLGTLTTLWFALPPLWLVRQVPPARVFRRAVEEATDSAARRGALAWLGRGLPAVSGLLLVGALALWQVGSWRVAGIFAAGLGATTLTLVLAAQALLWALKRAPRPPAFILRQGLAALYRPGNQTAAAVVALGLGMLLLLAVFLIQQDLLRQVQGSSTADQPNLFFIDIQREQRDAFLDVVRAAGLQPPELVPVVRGRLTALDGKPLDLAAMPEGDRKRILTFEYNFTYRDRLQPGETVEQGRFDPDPAVPGAQVSVADWWIREVGLKLGQTVTLDVQGVRIRATITSIRRVDWANRRANFSFVFPPGVLEQAPQINVAALHVADAAARADLQRRVVAALPNVTGLDVETVFQIVQQILDRIALVIQFMAAFSVAVGLVILLGTIATTKYQRLREAVLLKTLGATRWTVARILALEYLLLGGLSGLVGAAAAGVLSWALVTFVFAGRWDFSLGSYAAAWALSAGLVTITGLLSSADILTRKPLEVLRDE
jgi:putative ABC transport system permease protein